MALQTANCKLLNEVSSCSAGFLSAGFGFSASRSSSLSSFSLRFSCPSSPACRRFYQVLLKSLGSMCGLSGSCLSFSCPPRLKSWQGTAPFETHCCVWPGSLLLPLPLLTPELGWGERLAQRLCLPQNNTMRASLQKAYECSCLWRLLTWLLQQNVRLRCAVEGTRQRPDNISQNLAVSSLCRAARPWPPHNSVR